MWNSQVHGNVRGMDSGYWPGNSSLPGIDPPEGTGRVSKLWECLPVLTWFLLSQISVFLHPFPHRHLEANSFITLLTNHKRTDMTKYCLVAQSCPTLLQPMDWSPPGSSVPGISQARILDWVAISLSRGSSRLRDQPSIICIFYTTGKFLDLLDMTKFLPKVCNQRCS